MIFNSRHPVRFVLSALAWLSGFGAIGFSMAVGWKRAYHPDWIPSFDVADYVLQGLAYRDLLVAGDLTGLMHLLVQPHVHPPGHPAIMGLWMSILGPTMARASQLALVETALGLLMVIWLGHLIDPRRGRWAGMGAAVLTASSLMHQRLVAAPMSEPLSMVAVMGILGLAIHAQHRRSWWWQTSLGVGLFLAGLVRYNLFPMLLVPIFLSHFTSNLRSPRSLFDARILLWLVPGSTLLLGWWWAVPTLPQQIAHFFEFSAVAALFETWSIANFAWVPNQFVSQIAGVTGLAIIALAGFLVASIVVCCPRLTHHDLTVTSPLRLLVLYVWVGFAAITLHHLKQPRNIYTLVPVFYLATLLPVVRIPLPRRLWARNLILAGVLGASVAATLGLRQKNDNPEKMGRLQVVEDRYRLHALAAIVEAGQDRERVLIGGAHRELNQHLIELWFRFHAPMTEIIWEQAYQPACGKPEPPPGVTCTPIVAPAYLHDPRLRTSTTFVTIARLGIKPLPGHQGRREWTRVYEHDFSELAAKVDMKPVDEVVTRDPKLRVRLYQTPQ